jgi:hypothetical protein
MRDSPPAPHRSIPRHAVITLVLFVALCAVYLPDVGHGFVKDDFGWIRDSRLSSWSDAGDLFAAPSGFFRPAVSLSFALNRSTCGLRPFCYGLTNLVLFAGCAVGVATLGRALSLPIGGAILAAAIWAFNWHGPNGAILWISGRTALLLVLFSAFAAAAFLRQRWIAATALTAAAMLSKEEAILLPAILIGWTVVDAIARGAPLLSRKNLAVATAGAVLVGLYFVLRTHSGALTPANAPPYYRFSVAPPVVLSNLREYLDRSATFAAIVLMLFLIVGRPQRMSLDRAARQILLLCVIWWVGSFAITMFLPVRSSLYACWPAAAAALGVAAVATNVWRHVDEHRRRRVVLAGLAVPFLLWPIYHARNRALVREAELSTRTLSALQQVAQSRSAGVVVRLRDDRSHRPSLDSAFGGGLQAAADLVVRPHVSVWLDPPPVDAPIALMTKPTHIDVTLRLEDGQLVQQP